MNLRSTAVRGKYPRPVLPPIGEVISRDIGPPPGRRGSHSARPWWKCPFHPDANPSLTLKRGEKWFRCYGCGAEGDALDFLRRLYPSMTFPEAVAHAKGEPTPSTKRRRIDPPPPAKPKETGGPSKRQAMTETEATSLVADAAERLWTPEGTEALGYLTGPKRCLSVETIRTARLGYTPRAEGVPWKPAGIVLPWFSAGRLVMVKVRPLDCWRSRLPEERRPPKYIEAFRADLPPSLFPSPETIRPGAPLVITEGEFDCLLLGDVLQDLAAVVTLGSASGRPRPEMLGPMLTSAPWFLSTDDDEAGRRSADAWNKFPRARRVRPPGAFKDWTEAASAGVSLRRWWGDLLSGSSNPPLFTWPELAAIRWGPAEGGPAPGIIIDRPDPALNAADPSEE